MGTLTADGSARTPLPRRVGASRRWAGPQRVRTEELVAEIFGGVSKGGVASSLSVASCTAFRHARRNELLEAMVSLTESAGIPPYVGHRPNDRADRAEIAGTR